LIPRWARIASLLPRLANTVTQAPGLRAVAKFAAGIAQERRIPPFARETFVHWFERTARTRPIDGQSPRVMLWPDTFTNHFQPEIARAAVHVLERNGFRVEIPSAWVCCGRPLYDYGMLRTAKRWLRRVLTVLRPALVAGTPIVGLEPSCVAVFRDELRGLFPQDPDARRLAGQAMLFSEFLAQHLPVERLPRLAAKALVQGHCHHKALMKMDAELSLLRGMGLDIDVPDTGCCGMAGGFGFEKEHFGVSMKCGERVLLPAVRAAASDTLIIADGFSCREQIMQSTGRGALHLAQVVELAGDAARVKREERLTNEEQARAPQRRARIRRGVRQRR
jgi:Fe-S oxidoreductase